MENYHALSIQEKWIKLSQNEIIHIFIYYFIMLFISLIVSGVIISCFSSTLENILGILLLISFFCGLLGSTFYYIRKLYKSCIQILIDTNKDRDSIVSMGIKVYFFFRPIMGATLAVFVILGIYGGFFFLQDQPVINTEKFFLFSSVVSFFVGFSNGNIVIQLERNKNKIADIVRIGKEDE